MKDKAEKKPELHVAPRAEEAEHLVEEAMAAKREGDQAEAHFLMEAADDLDAQAADAVRKKAEESSKAT